MLTEEATHCGYNRAFSQRSQDKSMPIAMNPDRLQKELAAQYRGLPIGATVALVVLLTLGSASVAAFAGGPPTGPIPAPIDPATIQGLLNSQAVQAATAQPAPAPATSTPAAPAAVATPQPAPAAKAADTDAPVVAKPMPAPANASDAAKTAAGAEGYPGKPMAIDPNMIRGFTMPSGSADQATDAPAPAAAPVAPKPEAAAPRASLTIASSPEPVAAAPKPAAAMPEMPQAAVPVVPETAAMPAPKPAAAVVAPATETQAAAAVQPPSRPAGQPAPIDPDMISSFTAPQPAAAPAGSNQPLPSAQLDLIEKVFAPEQSQ